MDSVLNLLFINSLNLLFIRDNSMLLKQLENNLDYYIVLWIAKYNCNWIEYFFTVAHKCSGAQNKISLFTIAKQNFTTQNKILIQQVHTFRLLILVTDDVSIGNSIQIMNVYECNNGKNIFMRWKMECSIQRGDLHSESIYWASRISC